MTGWDQTPN